MSLSDVIKKRRSIRKYLPRQVPKDIVKEVLAAAGWAPSAHNSQPWRFIVLADASSQAELADAMADAWVKDLQRDGITVESDKRTERVERFANAPVLILACLTVVDLRKFPDSERRQMCERDLAVQSLGAATAKSAFGCTCERFGGLLVLCTRILQRNSKKNLKIPDEVEPQAFVVMGYPAEKPTGAYRKNS